MRLFVEEIWSKVVHDPSQPFGTRVLEEMERKGLVSYPNAGGWESRAAWRKEARQRRGFVGFTTDGKAEYDLPTSYGIKSKQFVWIG